MVGRSLRPAGAAVNLNSSYEGVPGQRRKVFNVQVCGWEECWWKVPSLLPVPLIQPGPLWCTHSMATLTSVPTSSSQRKSLFQVPATLIGTYFLLQKRLLGLAHLHTDLFVPPGAYLYQLTPPLTCGLLEGGTFQSITSGPCSIRGVGWYAQPADLQLSRLPAGKFAPGTWPTTTALTLASCL